jgi:hypothetical protein
MFSSSPRRKIAVLLLAVFLLTPWVAAAEPRPGEHQRAAGTTLDLLASLWSALTAVWIDEGCTIDPNGRCGGDRLDNGCTIDPFGRCGSQSTTPESTENADAGCTIDPYGGCRNGS